MIARIGAGKPTPRDAFNFCAKDGELAIEPPVTLAGSGEEHHDEQ